MVMKQRAVGLLAIVFLASCAQQQSTQTATPAAPAAASPSAAAAAPGANATPVTPQQWNVATTHCSVLLGAADDDRMAAVMFLRLLPTNLKIFSKTTVVSFSSNGRIFFWDGGSSFSIFRVLEEFSTKHNMADKFL